MTMDSQYSWPRFFMELADKLLAFKDDRQALIATLQHVYAELGMDLPGVVRKLLTVCLCGFCPGRLV